ncbi:2-hydroxycarboxylate transporter family protein [Weissella koreensis]|uniref:2-hydroxycarboxylate transporter family protein n=1 Tax=Weissella koreensis TaxID=165096 RepID=A0A7H1MNK7_9LACO|nr:2-hydroxycarboxylate transporter family protein [Weissella koreensis]AVH75840.1 citrate:sodium symporter [Weissella koreensis]QGN21068.1 citrate:sodium symporter [Weissella koreensis]QNT65043.1 2-hydroxycarboxylate transporter family protein [Weissella koreensis]
MKKIKISGVSLPLYILMLVVLFVTIALNKLPLNMLGLTLMLVLLGHLFYYLGSIIPVVKSYLGGGSVFTIFAAAALAVTGIIPANVVSATKTFLNDQGLLDFYIAALIVGSILGMNRKLLLKAAVRFIPVSLIAMVAGFFSVGLVGKLLGLGFGHSVMFVSMPMMAGGIGAGAVPLSHIYAQGLGASSGSMFSQLIPAVTLGNVLAVIGAALISKIWANTKYDGHGVLLPISEDEKTEPIKNLDATRIGVGMLIAFSFFLVGTILNSFVPKVHAYAFIIILVILAKAFNLVPKHLEDSVVMFNNVIMGNLTHAVLAGIGLALIDLNVLAQSLTWKFVILTLTSVIVMGLVSALVGKLFGLYPVETAIASGMANNSMGGTGNVAVLSASNRMSMIAFAQMGNRMGGALVLILGGILIQFWH